MSFDSFGEMPRLVGVGALALFLLIPLQLIRSVVKERHERYLGVVEEISGGAKLFEPVTLYDKVTRAVGGANLVQTVCDQQDAD